MAWPRAAKASSSWALSSECPLARLHMIMSTVLCILRGGIPY